MDANLKYDLTEGSILQKLVRISAPLIGTQFLQMTYNLTDMFWLGQINANAVASVGTAGMYVWLSFAFLIIGRMGAEIGVSQNMGRKDPQAAQAFAQNAIFLALIAGILFGLLIHLFRHPLIAIFAIQEAHVAYDAATYLGIVAFGMPAVFLSSAITGIFSGVGKSRTPFVTNGIGITLNMILTPLLIFRFDFGLVGAAWATVIAQTVVVILALLAVRHLTVRPFPDLRLFVQPEPQRIAQIFRWTLPVTIESAAFTMLAMVVGRFVAAFGADALAVQRVGLQLESFSWMIAMGFSSALTSFMGQNYGRGSWSRIHQGTKLAMRAMVLWGLVIMAIPWLFGYQMMSLFFSDEAIITEGVRFLRIHSICQVFICLEYWAAGIFRGLGKTIPPSVSSIIGNILRIPLAYFLSRTALGVAGLWWAIALGAALRSVILVIWFSAYVRRLPREDVPAESATS